MPNNGNDVESEILNLLKKNTELVKENNVLLQRILRNDRIMLWVRIVWYAVLIGLPFALYFYILEPYFTAFGSNYELFRQGMAEIPGLKGLELFLPSIGE
jgi:hypothetical protein